MNSKSTTFDSNQTNIENFSSYNITADTHTFSSNGQDLNKKYVSLFEPAHDIASYHLEQRSPSSKAELFHDFDHLGDNILDQEQLSYEQYLEFLEDKVLPYTIDVSSPKYIGHMTSQLPSFVPEISKLIAKMNQNLVKVETSNILTKLERQVLYTFHKLFFNLSEVHYGSDIHNENSVYGTITSSGSIANITSMFYARNRKLIEHGITIDQVKKLGFYKCLNLLGYKDAVIVGTRLMHYSFKKAANLLGIGEDGILYVDTDMNNRMCLNDLDTKLAQCEKDKVFVIALVGIAGATETGTIDPLKQLRVVSNQYNAHFHVDAAWGGGFIFSDEHKHKLDGIDACDSLTFCAHKLLYSAQGASMCLFRDTYDADCYSTTASYQSLPGSLDLGQYSIEGSRAANSLLIHSLLRIVGKDGYSYLINKSMNNTDYLRELIGSNSRFQLLESSDLNITNFRYIPKRYVDKALSDSDNLEINIINEQIQQSIFKSTDCFVSKTTLFERNLSSIPVTVFRVVISNPLTTKSDIRTVVSVLMDTAEKYDVDFQLSNSIA